MSDSDANQNPTLDRTWADDDDRAFVSFSLNPVQSFIEAARSVRDLWSGSYLLSYLVFRAMGPILDARDKAPDDYGLVFPAVADLPLCQPRDRQGTSDNLLMPCIPNKFIAVAPADQAEALAAKCENACHKAWRKIAGAVKDFLEKPIAGLPHSESWDADRWKSQVESFFEVRTAVLRWREAGRNALKEWVSPVPEDSSLWAPRTELLARLLDAKRSVRHVPAYFPEEGPVPQKCTLLGTYEQMGPAKLKESAEFWRAFSTESHHGTRTDRKERLCAVSLVKRFAWPAFFAEEFRLNPTDRRFPDTATIAAARWLCHGEPLNPDDVWRKEGRWSGQWLHWKTQDEGEDDGEKPMPCRVWKMIGAKKSDPNHPRLPTYYAVLMLDGDEMGKWIQGRYKPKDGQQRPLGAVIQATISRALGRFAVHQVRGIVEGPDDHHGTLVYAGGDDVLAMLPTETVLKCALSLSNAYQNNWPTDELNAATDATVSAGIAVAHHKEDLRFVLDAARRAEKAAKAGGRNALALTICRRSGEHSTAMVPWDLVGRLVNLVDFFRRGASDRWAYALRAELPGLEDVPPEGFDAEARRLVARMDDTDMRERLGNWVDDFLKEYRKSMQEKGRGESEIRRDFVTLCQSASFLARGRDD